MSYIPNQGDIIWLDFTPHSGHEQKERRPALVISNDFFNHQAGLSLVCPITSTRRNYPLHISLEGCMAIAGFIMVEQVKSVDFLSRNAEFIEKASNEILNEVKSILFACL
jgi:mRNA interferase MazF